MEARIETTNSVPIIPSLLNPKIFLAYIDLYINYRKKTRGTTKGMLKNGFGILTTTLIGVEANQKRIDDQLAELIIDLNSAKTFDDWYNLIFRVREIAERCKGFSNSGEISVSWLTLHAVANLIIAELYHVNDELKNKINQLIETLTKSEKENNTLLSHAANRLARGELVVMNHGGRQGKTIIDNNTSVQKIIKELALLGHPVYINRAQRERLIDYLTIADSAELKYFNCENVAHYVAPLCLQLLFFKVLYEFKFQAAVTKISFREFYLEAIEQSKIEKEQYEIALQANRNKDAQLEEIVSKTNSPNHSPSLPPFLDNSSHLHERLTYQTTTIFSTAPLHMYSQPKKEDASIGGDASKKPSGEDGEKSHESDDLREDSFKEIDDNDTPKLG